MPRGAPRKHESHPHLNPLPSRERNSLFPPLVGGMKGRGYFRSNDKERRNLTFYETVVLNLTIERSLDGG